jgi:3-deoxy-D-manno-octulosonate 8-phosphate phosphatase (KDO 8-P phosphatase)
MASEDLHQRLQRIELLALDVDGVLTNGQIILGPDGQEWKAFHSRDGMGLRCWHNAEHQSAIVTARGSAAVSRRAVELGIRDVVLNSKDKCNALQELAEQRQLSLDQIAFMGDDLQDLKAMLAAGVSISVADCPRELADRVDYVTSTAGGSGAVREAVEWLLRAQSRWDQVVAQFL